MSEHETNGRGKSAADYLLQIGPPSGRANRPFNDFPAFYYAGFWIRAFAFTVDLLCIKLITSSVFTLGTLLVGNGAAVAPTLKGQLFSLAIYLAYFILLTKLTNGQTIGKMIFGIKVVCFTEERLSWATVLIREGACRFVLQLSLLLGGYLVAAFTPSKQHVGDFFSDTSVVTLNILQADKGMNNDRMM